MATKSSDLYMKRKHRTPAPHEPRPRFGTQSISSHSRPANHLNQLKTEDPGARLAVQKLEDTLPYVEETIETDEESQ